MNARLMYWFCKWNRLGISVVLVICGWDSLEGTGRWVVPSATDPAITRFNQEHFVVPAQGQPRQQLFVFFPGTNGFPEFYTELVELAAKIGYDALALTYINDESINMDICGGTSDPACFELARREIKEGRPVHDAIEVDRTDSIENRLVRLLQWLAREFPDEGWSRYFEGEELVWNRMAVAGHSQGGGHAGFIARQHVVARCIIFSGADWFGAEFRLADWLEWPSATPPKGIYAFTHERDVSPSLAISRMVWTSYGLDAFGPELRGDRVPEFLDSHKLTTDLEPDSGSDLTSFHNSTAVDWSVPRDATGKVAHEPVWIHLLTHEQEGPGERSMLLHGENEILIGINFGTEGWATWQDNLGQLRVGRMDLDHGLPRRDEHLQILDGSLATLRDARRGPQFGFSGQEQWVVYTRTLSNVLSMAAVNLLADGQWSAPLALGPADQRSRGGALPVKGEEWERPAVCFWRDSPDSGDLCWAWIDEPWNERELGPIASGATAACWAPDGRHLFYTMPDGADSILHILDTTTETIQSWPQSGRLTNPFIGLSPEGEHLIVGGILDGTALRIHTFNAEDGLLWQADIPGPAVARAEGYNQLESPGIFTLGKRWFGLIEVAKAGPPGLQETQIWLVELLPPIGGTRLEMRVDDRVGGVDRFGPEFLVGLSDVFVVYNRLNPNSSVEVLRTRPGLDVFTVDAALQLQTRSTAVDLAWPDRAELILESSVDLNTWAPRTTSSPQSFPLPESGVFFRLASP